MATQKKIDTVKNLTEKLTQAKAIVLADYSGLTHPQLEQLRKKLKSLQAEFKVVKNRLLQRALTASNKSINEQYLTGTTGTLIAQADEVTPLKELITFFKNAGKGLVKIGLLGNSLTSQEDLTRLATLPSKDILLSNLLAQFQAPLFGLHNALSWNIRQLVWTLENVKSKKS